MRPLLAAALLASVSAAFADAPLPPPSRLIQWTPNRRYVAVADPQGDAVTVYRAQGAERLELWSIPGWQRSFFLADDGVHLVVCPSGLNLLPVEYRRSWNLLRFYERTRVVREWSLDQLIPDLTKSRRTASHYEWGHCAGFDSSGSFLVKTVDRGTLRFKPATGALVR